METAEEHWLPSQLSVGKLKRSMIPESLQRRQGPKRRAKQRAGVGSVDPMRLTSCIFQSPVTRRPAHPDSAVRSLRDGEKLEKSLQRYALLRLQGLWIHDTGGDQPSPFNVAANLKPIARGSQGRSTGHAGAGVLQPSLEPKPALGQPPSWGERIPPFSPGGLHASFCSQLVTPADIRRQMWKVKKLRKRLAEALQADRLAREAERMSSPEDRTGTR